jgi:hypothetical protein
MKKKLTWLERIDRAERKGCFTLEDLDLARSFMTCAVAEISGLRFNNDDAFKRLDPTITTLGSRFYNKGVLMDDFDKARSIYKQLKRYKNFVRPEFRSKKK